MNINIRIVYYILLCALFFPFPSKAQDSLKIELCNKTKQISFKEDSTSSFGQQNPVKFEFMPSIKKSSSEIEIRVYNFSGRSEYIRQFKFDHGTINFYNYFIKLVADKQGDEEWYNRNFRLYTYLGVTQDQDRVYIKKIKGSTITNKKQACLLIQSLLGNHIGDIPDGKVIDKLLKDKFPGLTQHDEGTGIIELKIGNHFRNFSLPTLLYDNITTSAENQVIYLKNKKIILEILKKMENEI